MNKKILIGRNAGNNSTSKLRLIVNAKRWPFIEKELITSGVTSGFTYSIKTNIEGVFIVTITKGSIAKQVITQPILIDKPGIFVLIIDFNTSTLAMKISINDDIQLAEISVDSSTVIINAIDPEPGKLQLPNFSNTQIEDDAERLFIDTITDLINRFNSPDLYTTIKSAGLLRLLLLDASPLIDVVNRKYKLRITYKAADYRLAKSPYTNAYDLTASHNSLYPNPLESNISPSKPRDAFLKIPCATIDKQIVSIKDVILYCAHTAGGVHFDKNTPSVPGEAGVKEVDTIMKLSSKPAYNEWLHQITFITLQGVQPLIEAILVSNK